MKDQISAILDAAADPVAIFTDFDGTLVEIAPTPTTVSVAESLPGQLGALYDVLDGALAIVTGRTLADIDIFLPTQRLSITGSHGAESRHNGQTAPLALDLIDRASRIALELQAALGGQEGVLIESKPTGVAIHFRASPNRQDDVRQAVETVLATADGFHAVSGKMVMEIRPNGTDKGTSVQALMQMPPFLGRTPVFLGDDVTDEDGFSAVQDLGGIGIKIGDGATQARFRLSGPSDVHDYFSALIERAGLPEGHPHPLRQKDSAR